MTSSAEICSVTEDVTLKKNKNFVWLSVGAGASFLGDHITLVAFPWLVLSLTQEPWLLGAVLALMGIPRGVFIIVGGAVVDRVSPKTVLLYSKYFSAILLLSLAVLVYLQKLTIPVLCLYSLLIGLASAFATPAGSSILPAVVARRQLESANGVIFIMLRLSMFIGPVIAGILLGGQDEQKAAAAATSLALLFLLDGLTFLGSASTVLKIDYTMKGDRNVSNVSVLYSVIEGFKYLWSEAQLRLTILYMIATSCVIGGLTLVGLPLLVKNQLTAGGDNFAYIMAANGFGILTGLLVARKRPQIGSLGLGITFLLGDLIIGILITCFYFIDSVLAAYCLIFLIGLVLGYVQTSVYTWVQKTSSLEMLGRVMSMMMFAVIGAPPIAAVIFGVVLDSVAVDTTFLFSGIILMFISVLGLASADLRAIQRYDD